MNYPYTVLYLVSAFLIGSLPVGEISCRLLGRGSLFRPGEWGPMYTGDVFEALGRPLGLLVTLLDMAKGWVVVTHLIHFVLGEGWEKVWWTVSLGGLLVVVGHCHSLFLGFRGGRGVATSGGVLLTLLPVPTIAALILWVSLAFWGLSTRPGTISAASAMPLFSALWVWWHPEEAFYLYVVVFLSVWTVFEYRATMLMYIGMGRKTAPPPSSEAVSAPVEPPPSPKN